VGSISHAFEARFASTNRDLELFLSARVDQFKLTVSTGCASVGYNALFFEIFVSLMGLMPWP
jgi:hypothetical protein